LFSHFTRVRRLEALPAFRFPTTPPYPIDDAAVHHVFDGGWIWVLRFSNGTTSAGAALTSEAATRLGITPDAAGWTRLLWRLPTVREQFAEAEPLRAFSSLEPLAFRSYEIVGPGWALLPSAAGFVDPLLSTGFPLTLLGVARLGRMLERERADWEAELHAYAQSTTNELLLTERLVAALYATMRDFPLFTQLASLYFGAACFSETARRLGRESMAPGFLLSAHPHFGPAYRACLEFARHPPPHCSPERFRSRLTALVRAALAPIDVAGLTKTERRNWHTVDFKDLYAAAAKLQSSAAEIRAMIHRLEAAT
jgi:FADH2 O2-dependent halogenase